MQDEIKFKRQNKLKTKKAGGELFWDLVDNWHPFRHSVSFWMIIEFWEWKTLKSYQRRVFKNENLVESFLVLITFQLTSKDTAVKSVTDEKLLKLHFSSKMQFPDIPQPANVLQFFERNLENLASASTISAINFFYSPFPSNLKIPCGPTVVSNSLLSRYFSPFRL